MAFGLALLGCQSPTVSPSAANAAETGVLHLTTGPDYDTHDPLRLGYVGADGFVAGEADLFDAETTIYLDRPFAPRSIHVLANGRLCDGAIAIQAHVEVDALLASSDDGCSVSIADAHPAGSIVHPPPRTALGAFVVVGSDLVVRPLDPGNTMEPIRKPAGDRAEVVDFDIQPGRYELALEVDGVVLKTLEIDLKRGQEFYFFVRGLAPGVPRDCGDVAAEACAAAVAAAYEQPQGDGTPAALHVTSVRVRPSRYTGGCEPYEPPVYDVSFGIREDPGTVEVTLGARPDGRLYYCTY